MKESIFAILNMQPISIAGKLLISLAALRLSATGIWKARLNEKQLSNLNIDEFSSLSYDPTLQLCKETLNTFQQ